jgi:hypothetical protein
MKSSEKYSSKSGDFCGAEVLCMTIVSCAYVYFRNSILKYLKLELHPNYCLQAKILLLVDLL